jgi:hypothetical protein
METVKIIRQTAGEKVKVSSCKLANLRLTTYIIRNQATNQLN